MAIFTSPDGKETLDIPDAGRSAIVALGWTQLVAAEPDLVPAKLTVDELKALAGDRGIDLGDATKKADILALVTAAD